MAHEARLIGAGDRSASASDSRYAPASEADVTRLVLENPLAWVVSTTADEWRATPLPLRPEGAGADEPIAALLGHFARSNPHADLVRRQSRALVLFTGVQGYISPSWLHDRTQAPTWNYATIQYAVDIQLMADDIGPHGVLGDLVGAIESGRPSAWSPAEMGARYELLAQRIIAFRAVIQERRVRFKLGQDERDDVFHDIVAALEAEGATRLSAWMKRANATRSRC
jgi:transcriptional regulator